MFIFMSKNEFMKWAELTATDFFRKEIDSDYLMYKVSTKKRMVAIFNMNTGNYGIAKCKRTDEFIPTVGFAIAWARYCKKDIPVVGTYVSYNELELGDRIVLNDGIYVVMQKSLVNVPAFGEIATSGRVTVIGETGNTVNIDTGCVNIEFIKPFMRYDD